MAASHGYPEGASSPIPSPPRISSASRAPQGAHDYRIAYSWWQGWLDTHSPASGPSPAPPSETGGRQRSAGPAGLLKATSSSGKSPGKPTLPPRQTQGSQAYGPRPGHDALWPQPPASGPVPFLLLSAVYGLLLKETKPRSGFLQGPCSGSTHGAVRERQARPPIHGWALTFRLVSHVPVPYLQTPAHITGHPATAPMAFSQAEKITRSHLLFSRLTFFYVN